MDFWEYTPSEFILSIEIYAEKQKDELKALITQAYYTAALSRMKRMPKLEKILKMKERKHMTSEEMLATVRQLNTAMGGESSGNS